MVSTDQNERISDGVKKVHNIRESRLVCLGGVQGVNEVLCLLVVPKTLTLFLRLGLIKFFQIALMIYFRLGSF